MNHHRPAPNQDSPEGHKARILCVDDDAATLNVRRHLLESGGYHVETAESGTLALQKLADGLVVDLVMLDFVMSGMNGDELAEKLREQYPDLRLIAVSAVGQLPLQLLKSVDSHLQKGQPPEILLSTTAEVLARAAGLGRSSRTTGQRTILCVEDEQLQLQLRKMLFESAGYVVLQAASAKTAMELFRSQQVDAVVMDYWLSGTNGTAVAEEMKALRPRTPIVMLSGFPSLPGEGAIVDAWLRKGVVEPEDILSEVKRLIDQHSETGKTVRS
jgi:CheY-like chemotaxis protein